MITILLARNEKKMRRALARMLKEEGYDVPAKPDAEGRLITIREKPGPGETAVLKDTIIELEDALYREKRGMVYRAILEAVERPLIERTLQRTDGNQLRAARILGINRNTMRAKVKKLGIDPSAYRR